MRRILTVIFLLISLSAFAQNKSLIPYKTPVQYEKEIRDAFKSDRWAEGRALLDKADPSYGTQSEFCELNGQYYYHFGDTDTARRYLLLALRDDESNTNALRMLIKLERECGNYSTSMDHINALLEFAPYDRGLWRQKIEMYRLLGNNGEADRLLDRLRTIYPEDELLRLDRHEHLLGIYLNQRKDGDVAGQLESLEELVRFHPDDVEYHLALTNLYIRRGRTADALAASATGAQETGGNMELIRKHVGILMDQNRYFEAQSYIDECRTQFHNGGLDALREQITADWAESLKMNDAYAVNARQYSLKPTEEGLEYLLSAALRNGYWEDALMYNKDAVRRYGDSEYYLSQAIMINEKLGRSSEVIRLQEELHARNPLNEEAADAIALRKLRSAEDYMSDGLYADATPLLEETIGTAFDQDILETARRRLATCTAILRERNETKMIGDAVDTAYVMIRRREFREASIVLDTVLAKRPDHNEALMMHADVSQQLHAYDSAYNYLSQYQPLPQEVWDVRRRLHALKARTLEDDLSIDNQLMRRSSEDNLNYTMTAIYTHAKEKNRYNAYLGYIGRDSYDNGGDVQVGGGTGVQLGAGYARKFDGMTLGGRILGSNMFFPRIHVAIEAEKEFSRDWVGTGRASWRHIKNEEENYHLFSCGASASKTIDQVTMTGALDLFMQSTSAAVYANTSFKVQYFPWEQERTNFNASIGVGNAPETALINQSVANLFSNLNTFVGTGVTAMVTANVFLSASATWYTMGSLGGGKVRNYIFGNTSLSFRF